MSNIKNPRNNPLKNPAPVRPPGGSTAPKTVYVCSPFRPTAVSEADREAEQRSNIERALKACRILAMMGIQPLAPHLYFTRFLKDELAAERAAGMQFGLSWLEQADELWYGTDCSVVEIQDAIEDAKNAADLLRRIQKMKLLKKVALDRETEQKVRFKTTDCWGNTSYLEIRK